MHLAALLLDYALEQSTSLNVLSLNSSTHAISIMLLDSCYFISISENALEICWGFFTSDIHNFLVGFLQQVDTTRLGLSKQDAVNSPYIASMGVYAFKTDILLKLLRWRYPTSNDFGSEIIPAAVKEHDVQVRDFRSS